MLRHHRPDAHRLLSIVFSAVAFTLCAHTAAGQTDPGQQAAQQAVQQSVMLSTQAAQQATDQMNQAAQQANQQAMQAAMSTPPSGPPRSGYGRADKPSFSPHPGTFSGPVQITMADPATPKAQIFYTLDGSEPTTNSTPYSGPVLVSSTTKLRAIARSPIYSPSRVSTGKYTIH